MSTAIDYYPLPADLPEPQDDGAASHLFGASLPAMSLVSTSGERIVLNNLAGRTVIYAYPKTGVPGINMPDGWDAIPGARGCTPQSCGFRDHFADLKAAGVNAVFGLSTQDTSYQRELRDRTHLPFELLSDADFKLTDAMSLPTFEAGGQRLLKRLTIVADGAHITYVFYPVFPPDKHAAVVLRWLRANPA
ncbi:MAG: peroxiredoxin [Hyphomicrobiales bacterium]|nr:peroxiredoxin [Hyphomicrobiales bacterium]